MSEGSTHKYSRYHIQEGFDIDQMTFNVPQKLVENQYVWGVLEH